MKTAFKDTSPDASVDSRTRVQVDFTTDAYDRLQKIKTMAGVKSNADTIRNALRLYDWYLQKQAERYQLLLAKDDDIKQVELLL